MKNLLASILLLFASNALADAGYSPIGSNAACPLKIFNYATNSCILPVGGGTSCGASPNQIQFGDGAGAFSCAPGLSFDGTNIVLPNGIKNAVSGGTIVLTDSGKIDLTPTSSVAGKCEITSGGAMTCDGTLTFGAAGVGRLKQSTATSAIFGYNGLASALTFLGSGTATLVDASGYGISFDGSGNPTIHSGTMTIGGAGIPTAINFGLEGYLLNDGLGNVKLGNITHSQYLYMPADGSVNLFDHSGRGLILDGTGSGSIYGDFKIGQILQLPAQSLGSPPACSGTGDKGKVALTSVFQMCICNGSGWVQTDGSTACTF